MQPRSIGILGYGAIGRSLVAALAQAPLPGHQLTAVMVRPHRIHVATDAIGPEWNSATGTIRRATYVGDVLACEVDCGGTVLTVERHTHPGLPIPRGGEAVTLAWRVSDTLAFDS